ncbi:MAG TPA: TusE/DsrC/DsvC family sulfur relay protein [Kaistella sp.]|jgi:sulfur relay protein, TusE/DsrC/DsvC family|nr:TusE/DsrC/DsvC family sulfur relay protein [Flavobacteriales bacterium]MCA0390624.1 TusE/DsrC/DsvC family sulfur relay protein [Bacteroidota bacterium]HMU07690.1 TusE/DsrC/DsvC family sulfur relay protein [Kaistella sp.]HPZ26244.1 TusE/DsrC/DsvC family sulfur relay protein [Kaistella sp.]HQD45720.1 TusE/DsrC/DsvC family sulfur relay protein [Kaistella sp.]
MEKTIAGKVINVNEEGYLVNMDEWNEDIAKELAQEENIELSPRHFEVLNYLRDQQRKEVALTIRGVGKSGVVDIKEFYVLFPKGPLKISSKVAGIPKPKSCI